MVEAIAALSFAGLGFVGGLLVASAVNAVLNRDLRRAVCDAEAALNDAHTALAMSVEAELRARGAVPTQPAPVVPHEV